MPAEQVSAYSQIVGQQSTGPERLTRREAGEGESTRRQGRSKHPSRIRIKPPATVLRWTHGNIGAVLKPSDDGRQPARVWNGVAVDKRQNLALGHLGPLILKLPVMSPGICVDHGHGPERVPV